MPLSHVLDLHGCGGGFSPKALPHQISMLVLDAYGVANKLRLLMHSVFFKVEVPT